VITRWLPALRVKLEDLCLTHQVPLGVAVGWIERESGGRLGDVTDLDERGYFQILPDESKDLGLPAVDHKRLSTDSDFSLEIGFRLVRHYRKVVMGWEISGLDPGSETAWRFVKFAHSIGPGAAHRIVVDASSQAGMLGSWGLFSEYCRLNDGRYRLSKEDGGLGHSPAKWINFVNDVFVSGEPYGLDSASLAKLKPNGGPTAA